MSADLVEELTERSALGRKVFACRVRPLTLRSAAISSRDGGSPIVAIRRSRTCPAKPVRSRRACSSRRHWSTACAAVCGLAPGSGWCRTVRVTVSELRSASNVGSTPKISRYRPSVRQAEREGERHSVDRRDAGCESARNGHDRRRIAFGVEAPHRRWEVGGVEHEQQVTVGSGLRCDGSHREGEVEESNADVDGVAQGGAAQECEAVDTLLAQRESAAGLQSGGVVGHQSLHILRATARSWRGVTSVVGSSSSSAVSPVPSRHWATETPASDAMRVISSRLTGGRG